MTHFSSVRRRRARYQSAPAMVVRRVPRGAIHAPAAIDIPAAPVPLAAQQAQADAGSAAHDGPDDRAVAGASPHATGEREGVRAGEPAMQAELERARAAAEAANEAKTRYLVAVSHEIRAPLNAIYGYAQLLERGSAISAVEAGTVIRRSAEHLTNLVEGILEISRIESGVLDVRCELVDLPSLLAHVMDMFRMQAGAKGIDLRYEAQGRVPRYVRTDEKRLRQILINLLSNAIKYTAEGCVTVSVAYRSQVAEIVIADTGIGIAAQDLERVFEPFERGGSPEAARQPGIGLGLAITRALSRILGGEITVTSTPGTGSRFKLNLFLPEPFAAPVDDGDCRQAVGYHGRRRTVLVIDDHQAQIDIVDGLLRRLGFVVHAAQDGMAGLALAERCQPDLVLLDIEMPGIDGWEVASRLRAAHGDGLRIVMVSANPDAAASRGSLAHDAHVAKPVDQKKLLATIGSELQLGWEFAGEKAQPAVIDVPRILPGEGRDAVQRIRQLCEVGHIRAVEAALDQLEGEVPASAPMVALMREYAGNFDLRGLMKFIDAHNP